MSALVDWLRRTADLVYPRNCPLCSAALAETECGVVCRACLGTARLIEPPFCQRCALPFAGAAGLPLACGYCQDRPLAFERTVCAGRAEGVVRECIHRFKYQRQMYFGPHLADWLVGAARRWIDWHEVDAIVPVPLHPRKRREREFNQAEYLAAALSRAVGVPVERNNLRRVRDTRTQTKLDAHQRAANLRGAFAVRRAGAFRQKRVVLVDDVFTTGATLDSCARMLRVAGARIVTALAVARGT